MLQSLHMRFHKAALVLSGVVIGAVFSSFVALAWTSPTGTPPANNVAAPLNVSATGQSKSGWLGVAKNASPLTELDVNGIGSLNGLAVFGNSILQASSYLNWG